MFFCIVLAESEVPSCILNFLTLKARQWSIIRLPLTLGFLKYSHLEIHFLDGSECYFLKEADVS